MSCNRNELMMSLNHTCFEFSDVSIAAPVGGYTLKIFATYKIRCAANNLMWWICKQFEDNFACKMLLSSSSKVVCDTDNELLFLTSRKKRSVECSHNSDGSRYQWLQLLNEYSFKDPTAQFKCLSHQWIAYFNIQPMITRQYVDYDLNT